MSYYYLLASLPLLARNQASPINSDKFLDMCHETLPEGEYRQIEAASLKPPVLITGYHPFLVGWFRYETAFRNKLVALRCAKLGRDYQQFLRGESSDTAAELAALKVFSEDNPARRETLLDEFRWEFLEQHEYRFNFSIENALIYRLKLLVLERRNLMTRKNGEVVFNKISSRKLSELRTIVAAYENSSGVGA